MDSGLHNLSPDNLTNLRLDAPVNLTLERDFGYHYFLSNIGILANALLTVGM